VKKINKRTLQDGDLNTWVRNTQWSWLFAKR